MSSPLYRPVTQLAYNTDKLVQRMRAFLTVERERRRAANLEVSILKQELAVQAEQHRGLLDRNAELESLLQRSYNNLHLVEGEQAVTADLLLRCQRHCSRSAQN